MTWRIYLMPLIGTGADKANARTPKYRALFAGAHAAILYGLEQWCLVACDTTDVEHGDLIENADVRSPPANLDLTLSAGAVNSLQGLLEAANVPAQWVNTSRTFREVLRVIYGMFRLTRRIEVRRFRFLQGVTLDDQVGSIPADRRQAIADAAADLGISSAGIGLTTTIREALRIYGFQFAIDPVQIGGFTL